MRKAISFLLSLSLIVTITVSAFDLKNSFGVRLTPEQATHLSDEASDGLVGRGPGAQKFVSGVICGAGAVLLVAGFAGGLFSGGLTAVIAGASLATTTVTACAEAF